MNYKAINDYEILYLIKEGNELALELIFQKYESFIWSMARSFYHYGSKIEDLVQEGRMVLYHCIKGFDSNLECSFYTFFTLCLRRELCRKSKMDYYLDYPSFSDSSLATKDITMGVILKSDSFLESKEDLELFRFCILDGFSLKLFAKKKNISYAKAYNLYGRLIKKLEDYYIKK